MTDRDDAPTSLSAATTGLVVTGPVGAEPGTTGAAGGPVDTVLSGSRTNVATDLALIGTFAALTAVCTLAQVKIGPSGVPITLQTFAVLLAGAVLGARRGALAVALYLAVGLAGLPIFANATGGVAIFGGASLGYLLAFPLAAWLVGFLVERAGRRSWTVRTGAIVAAGVIASLVVYTVGVPVMAARLGVDLPTALGYNALYVPFDAVKVVLVAVVASSVHRAFPDLLPRR